MASHNQQDGEIYDLLIVADATMSMGQYLSSLRISIPQIMSVSALTNCFSRVGLMYFSDYNQTNPVEWHGWVDPAKIVVGNDGEEQQQQQPDLAAIADNVRAVFGGDNPEASKSALAKVYEVSRADATTIVLLITDAPPHMAWDEEEGYRHPNYAREKEFLERPSSFGGCGPKFVDWISACKTLCDGGKRIHTFSVLSPSIGSGIVNVYNYLSTLTGGACICLSHDAKTPAAISRLTVEILMAWMGVEKAGLLSVAARKEKLGATVTEYIASSDIQELKHEKSIYAEKFFSGSAENCILRFQLTPETLKEHLPKKKVPVRELTQQWKDDPQYRKLAIAHLKRMIQLDVRAIALNPVLGSLWRTFCGDRTIEDRDVVMLAFSWAISDIPEQDEREQMKKWLEQSYDFAARIQETIEMVPEDERFPCVYLDPTQRYERADNQPVTDFRRDELLEIGRSCDSGILRRLGRVFTRLMYVQKASDMPKHIAETSDAKLPKIPLALASPKYKGRFWNILLHSVLPGTMLAGRPASILAALSLRMGVEHLQGAAEQQMLAWKSKWNDIEVPETWNVECPNLILDADKAYRQRREGVAGQKDGQEALLHENDRNLFEALVAFKVLEQNLRAPLMAKVGWTPVKSLAPIGPVITCRSCKYPRSVTVMGTGGKCGLCLIEDEEERLQAIKHRVSKDDNESTAATWVECVVPTCRGQYIVYHTGDLRVRPKCHYCRTQNGSAPIVECTKCLNRVIYPQEYRPATLSESEFLCAACVSGQGTIVEIETSAREISSSDGNTTDWLAVDMDSPSETPFKNQSVYQSITTIGTEAFMSRIKLFPDTHTRPLILHGKTILNRQELIGSLQSKISQRRTELISCSLCFSEYEPRFLNSACGRRGCAQRICKGCLDGWYGLNSGGCIINTASLFCPFCRRQPTPQTLSKHCMGIHAVGNLSQAIRDQGQWIYAWCETCDHAKQYVERICARGVPPEIMSWSCNECQEALRLGRGDRPKNLSEKPCPGCGVMCEKTSGCGHITCPLPDCRTHWCYFCGKQFDVDEIYGHMGEEHGGIYDEEDDLYGDYVDDEVYEIYD